MKAGQINSLLLLAKLSDGKIRQVITKKEQQILIIDLLSQTSKDGVVLLTEDTVDSIDWESKYNLWE